MGLDITFKIQPAIDAGLVLTTQQNGTEQDIIEAIADGAENDYIKWLGESPQIAEVPNTALTVGIEVHNGMASIRANRWGRVFEPLTTWLDVNSIPWEEC